MFGGLNSLFSGFAFARVIYAILIQRQELKLQREELRLQRQEMERFADAQEGSEEALKKQAEFLERSAIISAKTTLLQMHLQRAGHVINKGTRIVKGGTYISEMEKVQRLSDEIEEIFKTKGPSQP